MTPFWPLPQALSPTAIADKSHIRIINCFMWREKNNVEKFARRKKQNNALTQCAALLGEVLKLS
jgi:hypothetical protein